MRAWLAKRDQAFEALQHVTAYTDSHNDRPLLERAHGPRVVEPDPRLA